jgi:hypothetical protein
MSRGQAGCVFTLFDKDEATDLTGKQRKALKALLKGELDARRRK